MKKHRGGNKYFYWLGQVERSAGIQLTGEKLKKMRKTLGCEARASYFNGFHDF